MHSVDRGLARVSSDETLPSDDHQSIQMLGEIMRLREELDCLLLPPQRKQSIDSFHKPKRDSIAIWQSDLDSYRCSVGSSRRLSELRLSRDDSELDAMFDRYRSDSPGQWPDHRDRSEHWIRAGRHSVVSDDAQPPILHLAPEPDHERIKHKREENPSSEQEKQASRLALEKFIHTAILELAYTLKGVGFARWLALISQQSVGVDSAVFHRDDLWQGGRISLIRAKQELSVVLQGDIGNLGPFGLRSTTSVSPVLDPTTTGSPHSTQRHIEIPSPQLILEADPLGGDTFTVDKSCELRNGMRICSPSSSSLPSSPRLSEETPGHRSINEHEAKSVEAGDILHWDGSQERNQSWWERAIELEKQRGLLLQREISSSRAKSEALIHKLNEELLQSQLSHQRVMRKQFLSLKKELDLEEEKNATARAEMCRLQNLLSATMSSVIAADHDAGLDSDTHQALVEHGVELDDASWAAVRPERDGEAPYVLVRVPSLLTSEEDEHDSVERLFDD